MNTENTRVTRAEAARMAGVSERTINRWSAAGILRVERDPYFRKPSTYSVAEVMTAADRWAERLTSMRDLPLPPG